jgi:hypothetical protein
MGLHIGQRPGPGRQSDRAPARPDGCRLFIIDGRQGAEQSHSPHLRRPHADPAPLVSISTYLVLITVLLAAKIKFAGLRIRAPGPSGMLLELP